MKSILIALTIMTAQSVFAQDMSRTESYKDAYKDMPDGSSQYIGGCAVHQEYEGKYFQVTKTIVETFEPEYEAPVVNTMKKLKHVEKELLAAAASGSEGDVGEFFSQVDDITLEKLSSKKFPHLDLFRFNIGGGGGTGYYEVYARSVKNGKISYEKLSNVFDGDVEFCDKKVWLKK